MRREPKDAEECCEVPFSRQHCCHIMNSEAPVTCIRSTQDQVHQNPNLEGVDDLWAPFLSKLFLAGDSCFGRNYLSIEDICSLASLPLIERSIPMHIWAVLTVFNGHEKINQNMSWKELIIGKYKERWRRSSEQV